LDQFGQVCEGGVFTRERLWTGEYRGRTEVGQVRAQNRNKAQTKTQKEKQDMVRKCQN
jgi:hypothetical protein